MVYTVRWLDIPSRCPTRLLSQITVVTPQSQLPPGCWGCTRRVKRLLLTWRALIRRIMETMMMRKRKRRSGPINHYHPGRQICIATIITTTPDGGMNIQKRRHQKYPIKEEGGYS